MSVWNSFTVHREQTTNDCNVQYSYMFKVLSVDLPIFAQKHCSFFITCPIPSHYEKWFQSAFLGWRISQGAAGAETKVTWQVIKESCANQLLVEDYFIPARILCLIFSPCCKSVIFIFQLLFILLLSQTTLYWTAFIGGQASITWISTMKTKVYPYSINLSCALKVFRHFTMCQAVCRYVLFCVL